MVGGWYLGAAVAVPINERTVTVERTLLVDPLSADDRQHLNSMMEKGWKTMSEIVIRDVEYEGQIVLFYHMAICNCPQCRFDRGELGEFEVESDDDEHFTTLDDEDE